MNRGVGILPDVWPGMLFDNIEFSPMFKSFSIAGRNIRGDIDLVQGSLNCWFFGSVYTLPVLAIYRWHSRRKRVFKKDPSINKVLREEKEDIEPQKYDADKILWYSKI